MSQQRLRKEIVRAKREASFFADQLEKGESLRRMEEMVLRKGGLWDKYQRQVDQRKVIKSNINANTKPSGKDDLLGMIFAE